jgi:hypothetical protein
VAILRAPMRGLELAPVHAKCPQSAKWR